MNIQKFNKENFWKIIRHNKRPKDKDGNYIKRDNPDINFELTPLNYVIGCQDAEAEIKKRMAENFVRNSTTVVAFSWVCQKPDDYDGDLKAFFQCVFDAFKAHYGDNIIAGWCHFDETTPHIHIIGTPILDGKFNAKALITKKELQNMHDEIEFYLNEHGFDCNLTKAETKERKAMIAELKADGVLEHDENPKYLPMKELKERTQNKIMQDYLDEKERYEEEIKRHEEMILFYKEQNNIDDLIKQHSEDMIPKSKVVEMIAGLMSMVEQDLGEEKAKRYYKYLRKFGIWLEEVKEKIKDFIKDVIDR